MCDRCTELEKKVAELEGQVAALKWMITCCSAKERPKSTPWEIPSTPVIYRGPQRIDPGFYYDDSNNRTG